MVLTLALVALLAQRGHARAEKVRVRIASIAPQGSIFAIEAKQASRDLEAATNGSIELKWYFGGMFGDDLEALEKVRSGQLEGVASATLCHRLAPSMRVLRMIGVVQSLDEADIVINRLRKQVDGEYAETGFVNLGTVAFGSDIIVSRTPVVNLADLRARKLWIWSLEKTFAHDAMQVGVQAVTLPVTEAARAYDENRIDGFIGSPALFVGYQWTARAHYFTPIKMAVVPLCVLVAQRALETLDEAQLRAVRAVGAKAMAQVAQSARKMEADLLSQDLEKQGLKRIDASNEVRLELFEDARLAHGRESQETRDLIATVRRWLDEARAPRSDDARAPRSEDVRPPRPAVR